MTDLDAKPMTAQELALVREILPQGQGASRALALDLIATIDALTAEVERLRADRDGWTCFHCGEHFLTQRGRYLLKLRSQVTDPTSWKDATMHEKFVSPCQPPEGLERELLEILAEECAEVIQRVTKALRFGMGEVQPGQELTNAQRIAREVGDVRETTRRLLLLGTLKHEDITAGAANKDRQLDKYLQNRAPMTPSERAAKAAT